MENRRYKELEDRQRMLQLLHDKLEEAREKGEISLGLVLYESEEQSGVGLSGHSPNSIGDELVMSGPHAVALFKRLRDRYLVGRLHNPKPIIPFYIAQLDDLSDEGLRLIDVLPQEQLINAFREAIETAQDPDTPGTEEQKEVSSNVVDRAP